MSRLSTVFVLVTNPLCGLRHKGARTDATFTALRMKRARLVQSNPRVKFDDADNWTLPGTGERLYPIILAKEATTLRRAAEGPTYLLKHLRGEEVDWEACLEWKHPGLERINKQYSAAQWAGASSGRDAVCLTCDKGQTSNVPVARAIT
eukprot:6488619-Amphidinium_carterae.1